MQDFSKYNLHYDNDKKLYRVGTSDSFVDVKFWDLLGADCINDIMTHVEPHVLSDRFKYIEQIAEFELIGKPEPNLYNTRNGIAVGFMRKYKVSVGIITIYYSCNGNILVDDPRHSESEPIPRYVMINKHWILDKYAKKLGINYPSRSSRILHEIIRAKLVETKEPTEMFDAWHFELV